MVKPQGLVVGQLLVVEPAYRYAARVERVVDGDTLFVELDLGFNVRIKDYVRLYDVDTPEIYGADSEPAGTAAKEFVERWIGTGEVVLVSRKYNARGKYGRVLATLYRPGQEKSLNEALIEAGFNKESKGGVDA